MFLDVEKTPACTKYFTLSNVSLLFLDGNTSSSLQVGGFLYLLWWDFQMTHHLNANAHWMRPVSGGGCGCGIESLQVRCVEHQPLPHFQSRHTIFAGYWLTIRKRDVSFSSLSQEMRSCILSSGRNFMDGMNTPVKSEISWQLATGLAWNLV